MLREYGLLTHLSKHSLPCKEKEKLPEITEYDKNNSLERDWTVVRVVEFQVPMY